MFKISTNIKYFAGDIFDVINNLLVLDRAHIEAQKYMPQVRDSLKKMLVDNLDMMNSQDVKAETTRRKEGEIIRGVTLLRRLGEAEYKVDSLENFRRTGAMADNIAIDIESSLGEMSINGEMLDFSIGPEIDKFVPAEEENVPYPIVVEEDLLNRSGGAVGVVFVTDEQADELLEMLVQKNIDLVDRLFKADTTKKTTR